MQPGYRQNNTRFKLQVCCTPAGVLAVAYHFLVR